MYSGNRIQNLNNHYILHKCYHQRQELYTCFTSSTNKRNLKPLKMIEDITILKLFINVKMHDNLTFLESIQAQTADYMVWK